MRCPWAAGDPEMVAHHDREWGVPVHEDRRRFQFPGLEGALGQELEARGFSFAGPVICHGFRQATGLVNDHPINYF